MTSRTAAVAHKKADPPEIDALGKEDLPEAAKILRLAFGTFFGVPDLETFWSDRDYAHGRHGAPHVASFAAKVKSALVGSAFATRWGSMGFFGPLSVHPDAQERGVARALLDRTMAQFDSWGTRHVGLFTFAQSAKHVGLYQKHGFYARFLTAIMAKPVTRGGANASSSRLRNLGEAHREEAVRGCRKVTESVYSGLDLTDEIRTAHARGLGDTVLIEDARGIAGFAVCHYGPKSEAGAGYCYVKFGAVRESPSAEQDYLRLLDACEALAADVGMPNLLAGTNMAREEAYRALVARGYRTEIQGVGMHRNNDVGYCRPGAYVIDDWR